ncbi:hypothetical protein GGX14DRAFT_407294 [Mycena pura]|uniref:TPR-like protein n=1 Tax=Mycena pura TaxID=153505 RepID=A0AAD6UVP0_9AGAR|nr:hypothetical protein GGX14DRAFT_407294 [Mycena pura]
MADNFEHGTSAAASTVDDEDGWISAESPDILGQNEESSQDADNEYYSSAAEEFDTLDWENPDLIPKMQKHITQMPPEHPNMGLYQAVLGQNFGMRYRQTGHLKDLEAALQADREAVDLTPPEHPDRADRLQKRYRRLGELKDLEAALHTNQEAVDLTPPEHSNRANGPKSLAISFMDHYHRLGDLKDLEAALHLNQTAVDLTALEVWNILIGQADSKIWGCRLQNLATSFGDRYQRFGDLEDLEAAPCTNQEAVDLTPPEHPDRADRLQSLAISVGPKV